MGTHACAGRARWSRPKMVQGARWLDSGPLRTKKKKQTRRETAVRPSNSSAALVRSKVVLRAGQCQTTTGKGRT